MIQRDYKLVKSNFTVIDGKKTFNKELLLKKFNDFCKENVVDSIEKHHFDRDRLATALCFTASGKHFIWNLRVYETLGLNLETLLNNLDMEERDINLYNDKLQAYGLSLDSKLSSSEVEELQKADPDYERKKTYFKKEQ